MLEINPGLEAKTLFEDLQRKNPGKYEDGNLEHCCNFDEILKFDYFSLNF